MEETKTEKCPECGKLIGLIEAFDHDSLCSDCYWKDKDELSESIEEDYIPNARSEVASYARTFHESDIKEEFKQLKKWVRKHPEEATIRIKELEDKNKELAREISHLNQAIGKYYGIFTNHAGSISRIEKELRDSAIELMKTK